jgi:urate oxidase
VLPTDTQKNTVFAFAKEKGVRSLEEFALTLGDHFIAQTPAADGARIEIEEYAWNRIPVDGAGHDHSFVRTGGGTRTTVVNIDGRGADRVAHVVSGLADLTVLKSTGSEFHGFLKDEYTTLPETTDRILATSLVARWRYDHTDVDWDKSFDAIKALLLQRFAEIHSYALQQTLYGMGSAVLEQHPEVAEIKFSAPNKHHFLVDLSPFGTENPGEVFHAADRPYGLIEATVVRDDASDAGSAWHGVPGFC